MVSNPYTVFWMYNLDSDSGYITELASKVENYKRCRLFYKSIKFFGVERDWEKFECSKILNQSEYARPIKLVVDNAYLITLIHNLDSDLGYL